MVWVIGPTLGDWKRGTWIIERTSVEDVLVHVEGNEQSWVGHVKQKTDGRWTSRGTECLERDGVRRNWSEKIE